MVSLGCQHAFANATTEKTLVAEKEKLRDSEPMEKGAFA